MALEKMGATVTSVDAAARRLTFEDARGYAGRFQGGRLTVDESFRVDDLKVGYATEVVSEAALRFGWSVKEEAPQDAVARLW